MKLKPIEDGMYVHVTTEEDAKALIKWAYECGWKWADEHYTDIATCYDIFGKYTAYCFDYGKEINYFSIRTAISNIEFSDLIIPEGEEKHMMASAKEIISKIETYESREKEPEVKWVWRVFGIDGFDEEFFDLEEDAIARCEKLVKSQKGDKFAKCEKVCRIKK